MIVIVVDCNEEKNEEDSDRLRLRQRLRLRVAAVTVLSPLTMKGLVGRSFGNELLAYGVVTWTALVTLVCTVYVLRRGIVQRPPSEQ